MTATAYVQTAADVTAYVFPDDGFPGYFADEDDPRVQDLPLDIGEPEPVAGGAGRPRGPDPVT